MSQRIPHNIIGQPGVTLVVPLNPRLIYGRADHLCPRTYAMCKHGRCKLQTIMHTIKLKDQHVTSLLSH